MKIRIFAIGRARITLKADQAEHDELVRLREENKHLKASLSDKEDEIKENRKLINHFVSMS